MMIQVELKGLESLIEKKVREVLESLGKEGEEVLEVASVKKSAADRIIELMNEILGKDFKCVPANTNAAKARLKEGYKEGDFRMVFEHKKKQWGADPKMKGYLRPGTLLQASKFDAYLQEARAAAGPMDETEADSILSQFGF